MTCQYINANVTTGNYQRICERIGDGPHGFCAEHESLMEQQLVARGGNRRAVARFRSGLSAAEALWADDADLTEDLRTAYDLFTPNRTPRNKSLTQAIRLVYAYRPNG